MLFYKSEDYVPYYKAASWFSFPVCFYNNSEERQGPLLNKLSYSSVKIIKIWYMLYIPASEVSKLPIDVYNIDKAKFQSGIRSSYYHIFRSKKKNNFLGGETLFSDALTTNR